MNWLTNILAGLKSLFARERSEQELDEELDSYLEASAAHKQNIGMSPEAANRAALVELGSRYSVKDKVWSTRWESILDNLVQDLRFAFPQLIKTPGFTAVTLLSLALGIGANTAIFSLLNAVILRPLPIPQAQQLVLFGHGRSVGSTGGLPDGSTDLFSYPFYRELAARTPSFSGVIAVNSVQMGSHISVDGNNAEHVNIDLVSGSYFNVLGVVPTLGRVIEESDDRSPGTGTVAVARYGWFQSHFQGNPAAIGESVRIQGHDYTIIGVTSPGFVGISSATPTDLWIPLSMEKEVSPGWNGLSDHDFRSLYIVGRLKPGVSLAQATASTNFLFRQIIQSQYLGDRPSGHDLSQLQRAHVELSFAPGGLPRLRIQFTGPLVILMGIVLLVLLIACANIANMLLARGVARSRELAVRQALGATSRRIIVQLLTEALVLAVAGAALGIVVAWRASHLLLALASQGAKAVPLDLTPDYRVLGFTLSMTVLTALLFGVAPALRATGLELTPSLKDGRGVSTAFARSTLSRFLIVGQIALSILLLACAGLFLRSLRNLTHVDLGFDPRHVLVFSLDEYAANLQLDGRLIQLQEQIEQNVQSLPGVQAASFSMFTFNQSEWSDSVLVEGVSRTRENGEEVLYNVIGNQYLKSLGVPLLAGRNFTPQDNAESPHVAIVNETFARRFFPSGTALGRRFCICDSDSVHRQSHPFDVEIVGVVRDARYVRLGESPQMAAYFPYAQRIQYFGNLSVRSTNSPEVLVPAVRRAIAEVNPNIAVGQPVPLADQVQGSIANQRLIGMLSAFFAIVAVLLAAIGIYGLVSYSVIRRTTEIGIRLALGAQKRALLWIVFRESLLLLCIGLVVGLPMALATVLSVATFLRSQLFNVSVADPFVFIAATCVISAVMMLSAWLPARRVSSVDPLIALRSD
jgi:predicted permease